MNTHKLKRIIVPIGLIGALTLGIGLPYVSSQYSGTAPSVAVSQNKIEVQETLEDKIAASDSEEQLPQLVIAPPEITKQQIEEIVNHKITDYSQIKHIAERLYFELTASNIPDAVSFEFLPLHEIKERYNGDIGHTHWSSKNNKRTAELTVPQEPYYIVIEVMFHEEGHARYGLKAEPGQLSTISEERNEAIAFSFESAALSLLEEKYKIRFVQAANTEANRNRIEAALDNYFTQYEKDMRIAGYFITWLAALKDPSLGLADELRSNNKLSAASAMKLNNHLSEKANEYTAELLASFSRNDLQEMKEIIKRRLSNKNTDALSDKEAWSPYLLATFKY